MQLAAFCDIFFHVNVALADSETGCLGVFVDVVNVDVQIHWLLKGNLFIVAIFHLALENLDVPADKQALVRIGRASIWFIIIQSLE